MEEFRAELVKNIKKTVAYLKTCGTEGMSVENLMAVTPTPKRNVNLAPAGYRVLFAEVAQEVVPKFLIS